MMFRRGLFAFVLMVAFAGPAFAEFTAAEKASVENAYRAGDSIRAGMRAVMSAVRLGTTAETRADLHGLQRAYYRLITPAQVVAIYLSHGSVSIPGTCGSLQDQERGVWIQCAWSYRQTALSRIPAAEAALDLAATHRVSDTAYQTQLIYARRGLTGAKNRLEAIDLSLPYADPSPASEVVVSGLAPGNGEDAGRIIAPHGPFQWTMRGFGPAAAEYSTAFYEFFIEAYVLDDLIPDYKGYTGPVVAMLNAQDDYMRSMRRLVRIEGGEKDESDDPTWRVRLQRSGRDWLDKGRAPGMFHGAIRGASDLARETMRTHPNFADRILRAIPKATDAWMRGDDAAWRWLHIPGLGID